MVLAKPSGPWRLRRQPQLQWRFWRFGPVSASYRPHAGLSSGSRISGQPRCWSWQTRSGPRHRKLQDRGFPLLRMPRLAIVDAVQDFFRH